MSELESILDDIREGKDILKETDEKEPEKEVISEEISEDLEDVTYGKIKLAKISKESLDSYQKLKDKKTILNSLKDEEKVDKAIVLETMVMLNSEPDRLIEAKLTKLPSKMNKAILDSLDSEEEEAVISDMLDKVSNINKSLQPYMENLNLPSEKLERSLNDIKEVLSEKGKPIIILDRESVDLLNDPISTVAYARDKDLGYDKYNEGILSDMYESLLSSALNQEILVKHTVEERIIETLSINELVELLERPILVRLKNIEDRLKSFYNKSIKFLDSKGDIALSKDLDLSSINEDVESYNNFYDLVDVDSDDSVIDKILALVKFLE